MSNSVPQEIVSTLDKFFHEWKDDLSHQQSSQGAGKQTPSLQPVHTVTSGLQFYTLNACQAARYGIFLPDQ